MPLTELTDATFDVTLAEAGVPVIVDFWAPWCGPCRMVAPVLERMAAEREGEALFAKVNVDDHPELAARFGVSSIPFIGRFDEGALSAHMVGAAPKERIAASLGL